MKLKIIFVSVLCSFYFIPLIFAQSSRQQNSSTTLNDIYTKIEEFEQRSGQKIERLEQKIDQKFEAVDKRLIEIEKILAVYDERFQATSKIFMIFGSVFGGVIFIAIGVFGYFFNKLGQLIREIERLDARVDAKKNKLLDELVTDDLIKKFHAFLRQEIAEPARVSDEVREYKIKPE